MDELSFAEFSPATREAWRAAVEKVLKGADFDRRMVSRTEDGLSIQPLYGPDDGAADAGVPGVFPFVRGSRKAGARWRMEQRHGHPDPATANRQALDDLERGADGIRFAIADPLAEAPTGVALAGPDAFASLLDGFFTEMAAVSLDAGSRAVPFGRALLAVWRERGQTSDAKGDFHADPLAVLARDGRLDKTLDAAFAEMVELVALAQGFDGVRALGCDLRPLHEAGAGPSLELGAGLAQATALLRGLERAGLAPTDAAAQLTWLVPVDADVFMGIAKLRALRRCWSTIVQASGGDAAPQITAETSRRMLTRRDAYVNLLRNTVAAFGGAAGAADSVTVLPFTAAMGLPDRSARRMARNTQLILQGEASLDHVADPGGGSWYVEALTDQLAKAAWSAFQEIEAEGGFLRSLESGALRGRIDAQWAKRAKGLASRREMVTGVSAFPLLDEHAVELEEVDTSTLMAALPKTEAALTTEPLPRRRLAEAYEDLRDRADAAGLPEVLLLQLGTLAEATVRSTWIKNLVEAGGLRAVESGPLADTEAVAAAVKDKAARFVVLCSTDDRYAALAAAATIAARGAGAQTVALAGRPGDLEAPLRAAGCEVFLYQGIDVLDALEDAHKRLGIAA